jgi:hypothetical protein
VQRAGRLLLLAVLRFAVHGLLWRRGNGPSPGHVNLWQGHGPLRLTLTSFNSDQLSMKLQATCN